jgi:hypothetical protein
MYNPEFCPGCLYEVVFGGTRCKNCMTLYCVDCAEDRIKGDECLLCMSPEQIYNNFKEDNYERLHRDTQ